MKTLGWWNVRTGNSGNERDGTCVDLGDHYGHIDAIALSLGGHQRGFWCDGKLTFVKIKKPRTKELAPRDEVNVVVEDVDWKTGLDFTKKMHRLFKGRPVFVGECSQYGAVTLRRKKR